MLEDVEYIDHCQDLHIHSCFQEICVRILSAMPNNSTHEDKYAEHSTHAQSHQYTQLISGGQPSFVGSTPFSVLPPELFQCFPV